MLKFNREDIHIISRHSNWSKDAVGKVLKDSVYNDANSWRRFLRLFFISVGIGFITSGIIFFFAYNWDDLHKFLKIGMAEGLVVITTLIVVFSKINLNIKKIILTGAAVLVGVLFAVFGQIYQTGANAYDFFFGWTVFVTLWALISNFPPLWLVYLTLINTTIILYAQQVAMDWSDLLVPTLLFTFNTVILIMFIWFSKVKKIINAPNWFTNMIALAAVSISTYGINVGIFDHYENSFLLLVFVSGTGYTLGLRHGLREKRVFYLSIIPFSIIIIVSAIFIKFSDDASMFFIVSIFIIGSVTFVIKKLIDIQNKWADE